MASKSDALNPLEWVVLILGTFFAYQYFKRKKSLMVAGGQKFGWLALFVSFLAACGFLIVLNLVIFWLPLILVAWFGKNGLLR